MLNEYLKKMFVCRVGNVLQQLVPDIIIITEYAGNYNMTDIHTAQ